MTAKLPYFREKPLPVQVDHWTALDGTLREKTVSLLQGSIKDRYLSDSELEGAEFYPENAEVRRAGENSEQPQDLNPHGL